MRFLVLKIAFGGSESLQGFWDYFVERLVRIAGGLIQVLKHVCTCMGVGGIFLPNHRIPHTGFNWHLFWYSGIIMALYLRRRDYFAVLYASGTIY
ncbi:MAG: hypothetical protein IJF56_04575 [Clostridia bacterium]|nr:hypothetical protein [Clostridia bacterium]